MINPPTPKAQAKYRPDIDGLRAIAILSVVFYHAGFPGFSGGFVGVDVFFVISGFLISALLFNEAVTTGRVNLSAFYARRVRRLMPAGLLVVAVTLLLGGIFMAPVSDDQRSLARSAMAVAFFGSNFFFFNMTHGYFDAPTFRMPLLHTWSLAIEEQYYLIWPLLMLVVFRFSRASDAEGTTRKRTVWALSAMLLVSLAVCIGTTPSYQNFAYYLLPARVWEFAIGGLAGLAGPAFYARLRRFAEILAAAGLALIAYSIAALDEGTSFPGWAAILPVLGATLLIVGMTAEEQGIVRGLLGSRPMVLIGLLSYSWYLWHWPLLSIYRTYNLGVPNIGGNAIVVSFALMLAGLTYLGIERPIRLRRPWLFSGTRSTLFAGAAISLTTLLLAGGLLAWRHHQKSADAYRWTVQAHGDHLPFEKECTKPAQPEGVVPLEKCSHGPDNKHPKVLLWGDSHAHHMLPMLTAAFPDLAVYELTKHGCAPLIADESQAIGQRAQPTGYAKSCQEFNQRVLREIRVLKGRGLEGVVVSARWPAHFSQPSIAVIDNPRGKVGLPDPKVMAQVRADVQAELDITLSILERSGLRVAVLAPIPQLIYPAPACLATYQPSHCAVARMTIDTLLKDATAAVAEVVSRHPNVRLIQLIDFFCDEQACHAVRDGKILYHDDDHLTATGARELGHFLRNDLAWLRGRPDTVVEVK
jgi:peptidoglycan/LPS O-acetylase OafA/YrhL